MNKLITYKNVSLTKKEFEEEVNKVIKKFDGFKDVNDFILINTDNPIEFYILLFALWRSNKRVVFPNRDFFEGSKFTFVKYYIDLKNIFENKKFLNIEVDKEVNTILFSSGSTGIPKGVCHNYNTFFKNAEDVVKLMNIKQNIVSVTLLKPYLVSALSHFLVHYLTNSHLIFLDLENIKDIENLSASISNLSYVGSPMHLVMSLSHIKNKDPYMFFSSGDIFYSNIITKIFERFPDTIFFNIYGMVELGGRFFINKLDKKSSFEYFEAIGKNIESTKIKIYNNEILVKSDLLFKGYIKSDMYHPRTDEYFKTGDLVIEKNNQLFFYGRTNDEIKIAGNKISLKYIEKQISKVLNDDLIPIVITKKHPVFGNIIVLVCYFKNNIHYSREILIEKIRKVLRPFEIPHFIYKIEQLSYTQTLKIDRKRIANMLDNLEVLK